MPGEHGEAGAVTSYGYGQHRTVEANGVVEMKSAPSSKEWAAEAPDWGKLHGCVWGLGAQCP